MTSTAPRISSGALSVRKEIGTPLLNITCFKSVAATLSCDLDVTCSKITSLLNRSMMTKVSLLLLYRNPDHRECSCGGSIKVKDHFEVTPSYRAPSASFTLWDESFHVSDHSGPVIQRFENMSDLLMVLVMYIFMSMHCYRLRHRLGNNYSGMWPKWFGIPSSSTGCPGMPLISSP